MKQLLFLLVLTTSSLYNRFAAQDLRVTDLITAQPTGMNVQPGTTFKFQYRVKNIGNMAATKSHMQFYLANNLQGSNSIPIGQYVVENLNPNTSTALIDIYYNFPATLLPGSTYYLFSKVDPINEVVESDETNNYLVYSNMPLLYQGLRIPKQTLPYPVIFIHGLNSSSEMWRPFTNFLSQQHGLQFGGTYNYCLNGDGDYTTATLSDVVNFTDNNSLIAADYYLVNFDVDINGQIGDNGVLSNQSAITKQGYALNQIVNSVLALTGADKVMLVGHSMGGLCSRDFIQKYDLQANRTAKLSTIFTPHGGSNSTGFGFEYFVGLDELSEAVRDLRYEYATGAVGTYLFGGIEDDATITNTFFDFDNVDVNCNGQLGDVIIGLNNMPAPSAQQMQYASVIGVGSALGGDAIVAEERANINDFLPSCMADTFIIETPDYYGLTEILHTAGPADEYLFDVFTQSMDESDVSNLAFPIATNETYYGRIDKRSLGYPLLTQGDSSDVDYFRFELAQNGAFAFGLHHVSIPNCEINFYQSNGNLIQSFNTNGKAQLLSTLNLMAGSYFIRIKGTADAFSYQSPYCFRSNFTPNYTTVDETYLNEFILFPNPCNEMIWLKGTSQIPKETMMVIRSMNGQIVQQLTAEACANGISTSSLSDGIYFLENENFGIHLKFVKALSFSN